MAMLSTTTRPGYRVTEESGERCLVDVTQRAVLLFDRVNEITRALVAGVWQQLPGYDDLRMDLDDLVGVVAPNVEVLLHAVAERRGPKPEELTVAVELGERRAIQGVPIEAVVASWHQAERLVLDRLAAVGPPITAEDHHRAATSLANAVDVMAAVSTEAYRRTQTEAAGHMEQIATDLVSRLAGGEPLDPADIENRARLVGVAVQRPHRAIAIGTSDANPLLLARAQRALLDALRPRLHSRALVGSRAGHGIVVVPEITGLTDVLSRLVSRTPADRSFVLGVGLPRDRFGAASGSCREALSALEVGMRQGPAPHLVEFSAVAADVLLIENPLDAHHVMHGALGPLLERPDLIETLRRFLGTGMSIRLTARDLGVHENTVSYRLRRITEALGLDGTSQLVRADIVMALRALELAPDNDIAGMG